jgi:CheY-like chemotaxis protein
MNKPLVPIDILLVEDNPTDAMLTMEAIGDSKVLNTLHHVSDGVEAMEFLLRQGPYATAPTPGVILLDLNMPRKNGFELLAEIKAHPTLRVIPVVVLTTSKADEDIVKSYGLHANCFVTKPVEFEELVQAVREIKEFWFSVVTLPPPVTD